MKPRAKFYMYDSYFEVAEFLDDSQYREFINTLRKVLQITLPIEALISEDKMIAMAYKSVLHSVAAQVKGFNDRTGSLNKGVNKGVNKDLTNNKEERIKNKEEAKENKEKEIRKKQEKLEKISPFDTSKENEEKKKKLEEEINELKAS